MEKLRGHKISRQWTTALSAEMAGEDSTELIDEQNIQEPNGSIGYSPSTTAYFLKFIQSNNALALEYLRASSRGGGFPFVTVFDLFERAWALWTLSLLLPHNSIPSELAVPHLEYLKRNWVKGLGISFTTNCILFDSDDTCVTFETLARFGYELDIEAVLNYEEKEHFRCYPLEINPSIGSNVHALGALRSAGFEKEHPSIKKILNFLRVTRHQGAFWFDKWHISPYYITPHVVMTCQGFDDELCSTAVDWILKTQNANGSWGFGAPTAEETAYCLIALSKWQEQGNKIPQGRIKQGALWLSKNLNPPYPWQWIGKSLYHPDLLIKSAILTALLLVER